jgi:hypothetical protein
MSATLGRSVVKYEELEEGMCVVRAFSGYSESEGIPL